VGALEMQNLSVLDNRAFLLRHLDSTRALGEGPAQPELLAIPGEGEKPGDSAKPGSSEQISDEIGKK